MSATQHSAPMQIDIQVIVGITVALGCGLLVGIEREMRKATGAHRALAGVRTFALTAIAGALAQALQQPWLIVIGALMILTLGAIAYWRERSNDPGITTEISLFITFMLGVAAIDFPLLSAGVSVVVAGLLAARHSLHHFSSEVLSESELRDGLYLAAAALVVLATVRGSEPVWWRCWSVCGRVFCCCHKARPCVFKLPTGRERLQKSGICRAVG